MLNLSSDEMEALVEHREKLDAELEQLRERYTCISILQEVRRMSDMMKMFVEQELQNQIKENYPHMQYPPGLYAKVVSVRQNGELYEATLKILDKNKQPDIRFPEVPKVKTDIPVLKNEIVAIVLMYGECKPYIIGRCF